LVAGLSKAYKRQVAHAARNNNLAAVRIMLAAGLRSTMVGQPSGDAALIGRLFMETLRMAREILRYIRHWNKPMRISKARLWAGQFTARKMAGIARRATILRPSRHFLKAGAKLPEKDGGTDSVKEVLRRFQENGSK